MSMEYLLRQLLERIEGIGEGNKELFDSDVRHNLCDAIFTGFVKQNREYRMAPFGMFTAEGEAAVRAALDEYIDKADQRAVELNLLSFHDRLAAFQNPAVRTAKGNDYDEFFGHLPPEAFDASGNVRHAQ